MMKLVSSPNGFKSLPRQRVFGFLFNSTKTQTSKSETSSDILYNRVSSVKDSKVSIVPILDQWIQDGNTIKKNQLQAMIKQLKLSNRFQHALQMSQWMTDKGHNNRAVNDNIVRLELIAKVHGSEQAEEYFNDIPKESKHVYMYQILLKTYAQSKSVEKAECLWREMSDLGFDKLSFAYNTMLYLYAKVEQYEKMENIVDEMSEKSIRADRFTYNIQLNAYAAASRISEVEKILQTMEADANVGLNSYSYAIAAKGYIKAGLIEKALEMLKQSEKVISGGSQGKKSDYQFLLKIYASIGRKEDLYRIWNLSKSLWKVHYCMIMSLLKLDDITGAEKILEEWESNEASDTLNDFPFHKLMISAYCKNNLFEKAEMFLHQATEKGRKPCATSWEILATGFVRANQMPKAVEAMKAAFLASQNGWKPDHDSLTACLLYLNHLGDAVKTEEFVRLLGIPCHMSTDECVGLQDCYYNSEIEVDKLDDRNGGGSDDNDETDEHETKLPNPKLNALF
ncbi:Pentatricopeptide repeat-containing protein [Thalictrum thalictroides]|uniref:Pentatricopeptide repeat-containing protein n=1 Tax=Thalictrum thalictroides TaxID=46969 RepID=A0A7J6X6Z8_THATH|nr:Pentatricopeptide repeat-containing protein [Thalictrum thalictroides]